MSKEQKFIEEINFLDLKVLTEYNSVFKNLDSDKRKKYLNKTIYDIAEVLGKMVKLKPSTQTIKVKKLYDDLENVLQYFQDELKKVNLNKAPNFESLFKKNEYYKEVINYLLEIGQIKKENENNYKWVEDETKEINYSNFGALAFFLYDYGYIEDKLKTKKILENEFSIKLFGRFSTARIEFEEYSTGTIKVLSKNAKKSTVLLDLLQKNLKNHNS